MDTRRDRDMGSARPRMGYMGDGPGRGLDRDRGDREKPMSGEGGVRSFRERDRDMGMGPGRNMPRDRDMMGPPGPFTGMPRSFGRAPIGPGLMGGRDFGPPPMRGPMPMAGPPEPEFIVDREKTCPFLLRVWTNKVSHRKLDDYAVRGKEPPGDIQVYTWLDANLRELSDLIKEVNPDARARGSRLSFALIYPDKRGRNVMRQVGQVHASRQSEDDHLTLKALKFQAGDFMDVAIMSGFA